jgi:chromosome segregation ATPase
MGQEAQQKEEILQIKFRQREQQLESQFEARQAEMQGQTEHFRRRRDLEAVEAGQRALRELETQLRQEMQQKEEAVQAKAKQREQDLLTQLTAQAEAHQAASEELKTELEAMRRTVDSFTAQLARTEKERDDANLSASIALSQVQVLETKLTEASSFLTGLKNGKTLVAAGR